METSSFEVLDQTMLQTWEPVSWRDNCVPVSVFQKQICRSAVPPPEASKPGECGLHAIAFTAAS